MNDKRRFVILGISVVVGTLFSVFIFMMKRGGNLNSQDWLTLGSIFVISIILLFGVSIIFKNAEKNKLN